MLLFHPEGSGGGEGPASSVGVPGGMGCPSSSSSGGGSSDEEDEEEEEDGGGGEVEDEGCGSGEEDLSAATPLARLLKCAHSDNYFDRCVLRDFLCVDLSVIFHLTLLTLPQLLQQMSWEAL